MMETIRVNMTPCEDIKTIHASQNDNEAREWGFELHNNGELIDTSEITEQMFFKAYKGGTEQILPENTSTPTTSPFLGDIKYPQGLLTNQEFTYRQSPTEEDGLAKITDIKGNTLVWNQLVGRTDSYTTNKNGITITITGTPNKNISLTAQGTVSITVQDLNYYGLVQPINVKNGHKYFLSSTSSNFLLFGYGAGITAVNQLKSIFTSASDGTMSFSIRPVTSAATEGKVINETFYVMFIDLSQMFGIGNEPTTVEEFTSLFPLPYYAYNQGTLLSFMGNGIKTVGFNQWDEEWESGTIGNDGSKVASVSRIRSKNYIPVLPNTTYYTQINNYSITSYACLRYAYDADKNPIGVIGSNYSVSFTTPSNCHYILFSPNAQYGTTYKNDICINISDTERNGTYEPYTSSTLSLPISTYFPSGMKDVPDYTNGGKIYDELSSSRADARVGSVDLGSLNWTYDATYTRFYSNGIAQYAKKPISDANKANLLSAVYSVLASNTLTFGSDNMAISLSTAGNIVLRNTAYTDATAFKQAMADQNVKLYYELATPTETTFTTASLVTENTEIPLSNEDGTLIGKCTEQLSSESGFFDAKIKLADEDGECYSNKIQLHVERKPS